MKTWRKILVLSSLVLPGCLTTRAELREVDGKRSQQVSQVQERQAVVASRIDEYDDQFRALNGRIDVIENQMSQFNAGHADRQTLDSRQKDDFDKRFKVYEEALNKLEVQLAAVNEEIRGLKAKKDVADSPSSGKKDKDIFGSAESAFEKKDFKQAIVDYEAYRKSHPKGKSYPAATFKIGMSFQELGMKDEAKAFFEEVVAKYPASKEAKKASQRLKTLK